MIEKDILAQKKNSNLKTYVKNLKVKLKVKLL